MILVIVKTCDCNYGKTIAVDEQGNILISRVYDLFEYSNNDVIDDIYQDLCAVDFDKYRDADIKLIKF